MPWHRNDLGVRAAHRAAATAVTAHDRSYAPPLQLSATSAGTGQPTGQSLLRQLLASCGYCASSHDAQTPDQQPLRMHKFFLRWPASVAGNPPSESAQTGALIAPAEVFFLPAAGADASVDGQAADAGVDARVWLWIPPEAATEARQCLGSLASTVSSRLTVGTASLPLTFNRFEVAGSDATGALGSIVHGGVTALIGTDDRKTSEQDVVAVRLTPERTVSNEAATTESQQPATGEQGQTNTSELGVADVLRALHGSAASESVALVIRRPGLFSSAVNRASWEILVPKGAGAAVWQRLVVQCKARALGRCAYVCCGKCCASLKAARAACSQRIFLANMCLLGPGVVERDHLRFEAGLPCFPRDFPDAVAAYHAWAEERAAETAAIEAALPPPQRRSHVAAEALGGTTRAGSSTAPVSNVTGVPAWSRVVLAETAQHSNPRLHVLRGCDAAAQVSTLNALLFGGGSSGTGWAARQSRKRRRRRRKARLLEEEAGNEAGATAGLLLSAQAATAAAGTELASDEPMQLLAVQVQPLGRCPEKVFSRGAAELCMPTESDVTEWRRHGNGGHAKNASEQWPGVLVDLPPPKIVPSASSEDDSATVVSTEACIATGVDNSSGTATVRQPIGFVTNGGYSWERGRPNGVGFASVKALRELFSKDLMVGLCHTPPTAAVRSATNARAHKFLSSASTQHAVFELPRAVLLLLLLLLLLRLFVLVLNLRRRMRATHLGRRR